MKISFTQTLLMALCLGIAQATPSAGQEILSKRVSLDVSQQALNRVLSQIERKTKVKFMYSSQVIRADRRVTLSVSDNPLSSVLSDLLQPLGLRYKVYQNTILINKQPETTRAQTSQQVAAPAAAFVDKRITGRVLSSEDNAPLPGVSIVAKGTNIGTVSDVDGRYALTVPDEVQALIFSYVGYESQEVAIGNRTTIDLNLVVDNRSLSEVVVVGYGTQKRSDLTGAVSSVSGEELKSLPVRSVNEALQGRAAGVVVSKGSGKPGAGADIIIRGPGSINGMPPLYIVDGVRVSGTGFNFNVQDIESIEVLKDASAAAIYGVDAAGGVILVTTKRGGGEQKPTINVSAWVGSREPTNLYSLLDRDRFVQAKRNFGSNTSTWGDLNTLPDVDYVDQLFRAGSEQNYQLSASGGGERANYYISGNYQKENGVVIDNDFQRFNFRINSDYKLTKKLKVGESMFIWRASFNDNELDGLPFRSVPTMAVRDPDNSFGGWGRQPVGGYFEGANPVANELINHRSDIRSAIEGNLYADYEIIKGLNLRATFAASLIGNRNSRFREAFNYGSLANPNAQYDQAMRTRENYTANAVLTYDKTFGKHELKALAGYEVYREDGTQLEASATGFVVPVANSFDLSSDPSSRLVTNGYGDFPFRRLLSQFGRLNYSYAGKYLLTVNIRRDGTDRFATGRKFGVFPGFSAGWRISEEDFMRSVPFISNLKLRGGYGTLGIANIGTFQYIATYGPRNTTGLPNGDRVLGFGRDLKLANTDLKWETVQQTDIGMDVSFLNNALNLTVDWYDRQSNDVLYSVPIPQSAGLSGNTFVNVGKIQNRGLELAADYRGKQKDFTYNIAANISFNRNKVLNLDGVNNTPFNENTPGGAWNASVARTVVGQPFGQFFGFVTEGIYESDAAVTERGITQRGAGQGDLIYKDISGPEGVPDGVITNDDRTFIGNPWPAANYGFNIRLGWKGIDLAAQFTGVAGSQVYNGARAYTQSFFGDYNTTADVYNTSFFGDGGLTDQPRIGTFRTNAQGQQIYVRDPNNNYARPSDFFVEKGDFLRLTNLQLGYNLPTTLVEPLRISSARVYFMAQNLLTFTGYSGLDPEITSNVNRNGNAAVTSRGIDNIATFPRTRLISVGLDLSF